MSTNIKLILTAVVSIVLSALVTVLVIKPGAESPLESSATSKSEDPRPAPSPMNHASAPEPTPTLSSSTTPELISSTAAKDYTQFKKTLHQQLRENPDETIESIAEMDWSLVNHQYVAQAYEEYFLAQNDLESAIEGLDTFKERHDLCNILFPKLIEHTYADSPEEALDYALDHYNVSGLHKALSYIAEQSANGDNPAEYIQQVAYSDLNNANKSVYYSKVLQTWMKKDANAALTHFSSFPSSPAFDETILNSISDIAALDKEVAQEWARSISEPELAKEALEQIK